MTELGDIYGRWREQPFPRGSPLDSLDELHAAIGLADTCLVELVIPYVERGIQTSTPLDVLAELQQLYDRASALCDNQGDESG